MTELTIGGDSWRKAEAMCLQSAEEALALGRPGYAVWWRDRAEFSRAMATRADEAALDGNSPEADK